MTRPSASPSSPRAARPSLAKPCLTLERALALGACRVIPRELPNVQARLVDLAPADVSSEQAAGRIVAESQAADECDLAAWRGGERWVSRLVLEAPPAPALPGRLRMGGVYLITGGLGDIALELAGWLADTYKARLALVSRRALAPRRPAGAGSRPAATRRPKCAWCASCWISRRAAPR